MSVEAFLDTNVLVYAAVSGDGEATKRHRSLELIETVDFGLSAQVLQEFYVTVVRKFEVPLSPERALEWIEELETFPCLPVDSSVVKVGAEVSQRYRVSYWDGAIIAAAMALGAHTLYSEDLNHDQLYGEVRVCNPFAEPQPTTVPRSTD